MYFSYLSLACVFFSFVAGFLVAPPAGSTPAPETTAKCSGWVVISSSTSCGSVIAEFDITLTLFESMNPISSLAGSCSLLTGFAYCVQENFGVSSSSSTSTSTLSTKITTSSASTTPIATITASLTTSADGISTPTPFQPGMITSCNAFYFVVSGDTCAAIATKFGITVTEFETWNPAVGSTCEFLGLGDWVCVDIIGVTITTTTTNGISTPTPIQTGIVTNCDSFHLVVSGDTCSSVAAAAKISVADVEAWNPAVGADCEFLDLGDYICIGLIGMASPTITTITTATTTIGNGITTPTPFQSGMATNCNRFQLVVSGDTCALISQEAGISLSNFEAWNPAVGTTCAFLDLGDYVCISIL